MNDYASKQFRRIYKPYLVEGAKFGNEFDIPTCPCNAKSAPKNLIHYADIDDKSQYEGFVHFYTYEYKFEDVWTEPYKALEKFKRCGGVITPDFATYQDMPAALKVYNTYRMRAIGYWLTTYGVQVINNVRWGTPETFRYCFLGIPQNSIVCVSTVGCNIKNEHDKKRFGAGLEIMVETLRPRHILMYGNTGRNIFTPYIERGIPVTFYDRPRKDATLPITLTVAEFAKKYSLHDGNIDEMEYDAENKKLTLTIYIQNGLAEFIFDNVSVFEYNQQKLSNSISEDIDAEVVTTEFNEGVLKIIVSEYKDELFDEDYFQINIKAESVTINPLD